jgi:hypothetical protein
MRQDVNGRSVKLLLVSMTVVHSGKGKGMKITWTKPYECPQGRKKIMVETAIIEKGPSDRFHLYGGKRPIETMWTLFDQETDTQHFLYGEGWEGARKSAARRILEVLKK